MNCVEILKKEHVDIERELLEFETIMNSEEINYSNLIHTFKKLHDIWNEHENKEEKVFPILEKERIKIPVHRMLFEHKDLKTHKKAIIDAISSGNEGKIREMLGIHGKKIIDKLREHIKFEDEILYTIALEEFNDEELKELEKAI